MSNRCLTLAALIACTTFAACGGSGGRGTTLQRTLGLGNRSKSLDANVLGKGCIDVQSLTKQIAASDKGATLHSRDYDLGRVRAVKGDHSIAFETVKDKASLEELARRSFSGENAPVYKTSAKAADVLAQSPAKELLAATQTDCQSVKFASGAEFKVTYSNQNFITMKNAETGEVREYGRQGNSLTLTTFVPTSIDNCNGGKNSGDTERISTRLAWGNNHDAVNLVSTYAQRLGVAPQANGERFKGAMSALTKKIDDVKCGQ